jgi:hypothetical protein
MMAIKRDHGKWYRKTASGWVLCDSLHAAIRPCIVL